MRFMVMLFLFTHLMIAAEGEITQVVSPSGTQIVRQTIMNESGLRRQSFEVELIMVKPMDARSQARWSELAAIGYHVVSTLPQPDGSMALYLERSQWGQVIQVRLPDAVSQDATMAEQSRARIQASLADHGQQNVPQQTPAGSTLVPKRESSEQVPPAVK